MKKECSNYFYGIATMLCVHSCMVTNHSAVSQNVLAQPIQGTALDRMKFIYGMLNKASFEKWVQIQKEQRIEFLKTI